MTDFWTYISKKYWLTVSFFVACLVTQAQQNIQFSQYVFNGLAVNPAYAGYKEDWFVQATYRQQWTSFPGAPQSASISADGIMNSQNNQNHALGLQLTWDKLGAQENTALYANYAFRIQLNAEDSKRLCLGIGIGADQYGINGTLFNYNDANDPNIPVNKITTIKPNTRVGVYYYSPKWYAGVSVMDVLSNGNDTKIYFGNGLQYANLRKTKHLYVTTGFLVNATDNLVLKPSLLIKEDFNGPTSVDINLFALLSQKLWIGASYRTAFSLWNKQAVDPSISKRGAIAGIIELFAIDNMRIGYSYDYLTSGLSGYQGGSHEISVGILLPQKNNHLRIKSPRYF